MKNRKPMVLARRGGRLECDVLAVPDWEGFEKLARFLEKHYAAQVREKTDGPDARRWVLDVEGCALELQHEDPWGKVIVAADETGEVLLRRVAEDLAARLADVESLTAGAARPDSNMMLALDALGIQTMASGHLLPMLIRARCLGRVSSLRRNALEDARRLQREGCRVCGDQDLGGFVCRTPIAAGSRGLSDDGLSRVTRRRW